MTRKPRKITDHLVTARLLTHAYGQMGEIATAGGFFTYFMTMEVFGFPAKVIFSLLSVPCVNPVSNTTTNPINTNINTWYDFIQPNFGNVATTLPTGQQPYNNPYIPTFASSATLNTNFPDWISTINNQLDLRGFYLTNCGNALGSVNGYCQRFEWPTIVHDLKSTVTKHSVAFTTESIFYAQSAYFVTIVMVQWSNVFACKSRKVNIFLI